MLAQFRRTSDAVSYFSTECRPHARMAASSFTRCGRLPVASSCWIVAITMSSLIPSRSTLWLPSAAGDGGGDSVVGCFFSCSFLISGGLMMRHFLLGRSLSSPSAMVDGGEGCDTARDRLGSVMPSSVSERLLRRVLYPMLADVRPSAPSHVIAAAAVVGCKMG